MEEIKTEGKVKDKTKNSPCQRNTTGKSQLTGLYVYGTVYGYSGYLDMPPLDISLKSVVFKFCAGFSIIIIDIIIYYLYI